MPDQEELLLTGIIMAAVAGQTRGASVSRLAASPLVFGGGQVAPS